MTKKKSKSKKAASKSAKGGARGKASQSALPPKIYANVSPHSIGGVSMFEGQHQIHAGTVTNFFSDGEIINAAVSRLQEAGFEILQISPLTINIAGTAAQYRRSLFLVNDIEQQHDAARRRAGYAPGEVLWPFSD